MTYQGPERRSGKERRIRPTFRPRRDPTTGMMKVVAQVDPRNKYDRRGSKPRKTAEELDKFVKAEYDRQYPNIDSLKMAQATINFLYGDQP